MVKISKNANNDTADIDFNYNKGTSEVATIAVECTTNENFSNIKFLVKDFKKAKAVYLKDSQVLDTPPAGVQGVKIVAEMAVVPQK